MARAEERLYKSRHLHAHGAYFALTDPAAKDPLQVALGFAGSNAGSLGVLDSDLGELELTRTFTSASNGLTHFYFNQRAHGIRVHLGRLHIHVHPSGHIVSVGAHLSPDVHGRLNRTVAAIDVRTALEEVARRSGPGVSADPFSIVEDRGGSETAVVVDAPRLSSRPILVELRVVPTESGVRLAWSARVHLPDGSDAFEALVDAEDGQELKRRSLVARGHSQYTVFPLPVESPAHGTQVTVPENPDPAASPDGWTDPQAPPDCAATSGNNVEAYELELDGTTKHWAETTDCDFTFESLTLARLDDPNDLGLDMSLYRDAAITNIFHTVNRFHDILYTYGFNEVAGSFQNDNFGRGGTAGDRIEVRRNEGAARWFGTPTPVLKLGKNYIRPLNGTTFQASGATKPVSVAAGDLDGDGALDAATANEASDNVTVWWNGGAGITFTPQNEPLGAGDQPSAVAVADFNLDGKLDLLVAMRGTSRLVTLWNTSTPQDPRSFAAGSPVTAGLSQPSSLAVGDLNGSGLPDAAVGNAGTGDIAIFRNQWGLLSYVSSVALTGAPQALVARDLSGAGHLDLVVATRDADTAAVLQGTGSSFSFSLVWRITYSDPTTDPSGVDAADFDGDGDLDLAVAEEGKSRVSLWRHNGSYGFGEVRWVHVNAGPAAVVATRTGLDGSMSPLDLNPGDTGGPGYPDILTASSPAGTVSTRMNRHYAHAWLFSRQEKPPASLFRSDLRLGVGLPRALVAGDFSGDGNAGVAIAHAEASAPARLTVLHASAEGRLEKTSGGVYLWRDESLDNGIIAHELGHGVTEILSDIGAGAHGGGLYEGTGDVFALIFTQNRDPNNPNTPRGLATFPFAEPADGQGWRSLPYSCDFLLNDLSFADYNRRRCYESGSPGNPPPCKDPSWVGTDGGELQAPHAVGEIWASALWDLYCRLCAKHGRSDDLSLGAYDPAAGGDNITLQLLIDALKLAPPGATFLEARDAVVLADRLDFAGENHVEIWGAFRLRGMGWGACDDWDSANETCASDPSNNAVEVLENLSSPPSGAISGVVFNDLNGDGDRDPGEPDLTSRTVFLDQNRNGILDNGEIWKYTYYSGSYLFPYLRPGTYTVAVVQKAGWRQTLPGGSGTTLFGLPARWDGTPHASGTAVYADVWGDGKLAFVGHVVNGGVDIIDLARLEAEMEANPDCLQTPQASHCANAGLVGHWSDPDGNDRIQDIKVHGGLAYFASDNGGGVSIVDFSDPALPETLVRIKAEADPGAGVVGGGFDEVHNVSLEGKYLFFVDGRTPDLAVFDITPLSATPPGNPVKVNVQITFPAGGGGSAIHDVTAVNGRLYACEKGVLSGWIHIYKTTGLPGDLVHVMTFASGRDTHSAWPTDDGSYLVVCRETQDLATPDSNQVEIWNLDDTTAPAAVICMPDCGGPEPEEAVCPHNPVVDGDRLYVSWYQAGALAYDIADPANPQLLRRYDTFPDPVVEGVFKGCWGLYPFLGPDRILGLDTDYGLFVLSDQTTYTVVVEGDTVTADFGFQQTQ